MNQSRVRSRHPGRGFETGTGDLSGFLDAHGNLRSTIESMCSHSPIEPKSIWAPGWDQRGRCLAFAAFGNWLYAVLLGFLTAEVSPTQPVGCVSLDAGRMAPIATTPPSGLHFTPAYETWNSLRGTSHCSGSLSVCDTNEKVTNVFRDGIRFPFGNLRWIAERSTGI